MIVRKEVTSVIYVVMGIAISQATTAKMLCLLGFEKQLSRYAPIVL